MRYKTFLAYLAFSGIFLTLAIIAGIEFSSLPYGGTWGSDAQYYYLAAAGKGGEQSCTAYLGYGYVCTFTAFVSVLDLPVAFYALIGLLYIFIAFRYYRPNGQTSMLIWIVLVLNPIVLWTFLKGVKEGFVIACLLVLVKIYGRMRERFSVLNIFLFAGAILVLSTVKFEAVAFVVFAVAVTEIVMRANNSIKIAVTLVGSAVAVLFVLDQLAGFFPELAFLQKLMAHRELFFTQEISEPDAHVNYLSAIFRFLAGPGPITPISSLFQDTGFYEPTVIGKIMIFLGSLCWLAALGLSALGFMRVLSNPKYRTALGTVISHEVVFSASMSMFYILTYAYMYGGMVDTRHRAVVYVLLFPLLGPLASVGTGYIFPHLKNNRSTTETESE
jgi:hypothetical protein